jgi:predicted dithiol-disulfide oxidoreductase (DUF899 family)
VQEDESMCPACLATAALAVAGATSAGGLTAFAVTVLRNRRPFNPDFGRGPETPQPDQHQDGEMFGLSAFIRDGDAVYRTYFTTNRGVEALGPVWTLLDLTALGRQEEWEDSPEGTPQTPPYQWWRRHDEYGG